MGEFLLGQFAEDLAQGGGEGVRIARPAVFAAEESVVAAREGDGGRPEPPGHATAVGTSTIGSGLLLVRGLPTGRERFCRRPEDRSSLGRVEQPVRALNQQRNR